MAFKKLMAALEVAIRDEKRGPQLMSDETRQAAPMAPDSADDVRRSLLHLAKATNALAGALDALAHQVYDTGAKPGRTGTSHPQTMELHEALTLVRDAVDELRDRHE